MTASVCKVFHIFRVMPPADSAAAAATFDADQRSTCCSLNQMNLSDPASKQIALPLKIGGHGFPAVTPPFYGLYAASLVDSKLRIPHASLPTPEFYYWCARIPITTFVDNLPIFVKAPSLH